MGGFRPFGDRNAMARMRKQRSLRDGFPNGSNRPERTLAIYDVYSFSYPTTERRTWSSGMKARWFEVAAPVKTPLIGTVRKP
jgi:hypothetical protein